MGAWVVGRNLAGYMSETDVVAFESWADARDYYVAEARDYADRDDDAAWETLPMGDEAKSQGYSVKRDTYPTGDVVHVDYGDDTPAMLATVESILTDDGPEEGKPHGMLVEDNDGRLISFWLQWSDDEQPDEDFM